MLATQEIEALRWQAREVIRDIDDRPHLLVRIRVERGHFPHRDAIPFMRIVQPRRHTVAAWFTEVGDGNRTLDGYFPTDLPESGAIELGYGDHTIGRVPLDFRAEGVQRLGRDRLPAGLIQVTTELVRARMGG